MKTIQEILQLSISHLESRGVQNPRRQAEDVVSLALDIPRMELYMQFDRPLTEQELEACRQFLQRRAKGEPSQYIHGKVDFYECVFKVGPDVLIPRHETEILVDRVVNELQKEELSEKNLWDLCTGSGCIGISLKKKFPELNVSLSDLSREALTIAAANADANEVEVKLLQGDLLVPFEGHKAHYVICNPPYISREEYDTLEREVRDFEPGMALLGGEDGLDFYRRLEKELPRFLHEGARVWFEIGTGQGQSIEQIYSDQKWKEITVDQDYAGHDRFVSFLYQP